jgi:hypothetical protein
MMILEKCASSSKSYSINVLQPLETSVRQNRTFNGQRLKHRLHVLLSLLESTQMLHLCVPRFNASYKESKFVKCRLLRSNLNRLVRSLLLTEN